MQKGAGTGGVSSVMSYAILVALTLCSTNAMIGPVPGAGICAEKGNGARADYRDPRDLLEH